MRKINRSQKRIAALAWVLCAICVMTNSVQVILWTARLTARPTLFDAVEAYGWGLFMPVVFSILGALVIARQPGNRVGWLMMIITLVSAIPISDYLYTMPHPTVITPRLWLLLWVEGWSWIPLIFPIFLIPLYYPTGQLVSPRWKWVTWLAVGMWLFFITATAFSKTMGPPNSSWTLPNPIGFIPDVFGEGPILIVWGAGLVTIVLASVISLFVRFRLAQEVERQQIKWLLYAGALFVLIYALIYVLSSTDETVRNPWTDLLLLCSILSFPVTISIAILRYRLWDIDLIIRRTLQYSLLTGLLVLFYFGGVVLLQEVLSPFTGQENSPIVTVLTTLAIAALFNPLRNRVQKFIDQRFYRQKYNAEQMLEAFAKTARDKVELDALTGELLRVVQETMKPEQAILWLQKLNQDKEFNRVANETE